MRRGAPPVQWIRVTRAPARRAAGGAGCAHAAAARGSEKRQRASEREKRPGERRRVHRETGEVRRARGATPRPRINLYCRAQVGQWPMGRSRVPIAAKGAPRARLHIGHIARARAAARARGLSAVSCVGDGRVSRLAPLCALSLSRHTLCEPCTHTHTRRPPQNSLQNGPRCTHVPGRLPGEESEDGVHGSRFTALSSRGSSSAGGSPGVALQSLLHNAFEHARGAHVHNLCRRRMLAQHHVVRGDATRLNQNQHPRTQARRADQSRQGERGDGQPVSQTAPDREGSRVARRRPRDSREPPVRERRSIDAITSVAQRRCSVHAR